MTILTAKPLPRMKASSAWLLNLWGDPWHGVETMETYSPRSDEVAGGSTEDCKAYDASSPRTVNRILRRLEVEAGIGFSSCTFVDYGCGKGRVVMVAARFDLKKVIGIEYSDFLYRIANYNLGAYRWPIRRDKVEFWNVSAAEAEVPSGPLIMYFFNPFGENILNRILANLKNSLEREPRTVFMICAGRFMNKKPVIEFSGAREIFRDGDILVLRVN